LVTIMTGTAQWHILCTSWIRWSDIAGRDGTVRKVSQQELFPSFDRQPGGDPRRQRQTLKRQYKRPRLGAGPLGVGESRLGAEFKEQGQTTL
jgi:hypothetical protein